jgi:hypothetical protein
MATRNTPRAPRTLKPIEPEVDTRNALDLMLDNATAHQAEGQLAWREANDATDDKVAYAKVLAASAYAGLSWEAAYMWQPTRPGGDRSKDAQPDAGELAIRQLHAAMDPSSCKTHVDDAKDLLALIVDASDVEVAASAKQKKGVVPARDEGADAAAALASLNAMLAQANTVGDTAAVALFTAAIEAVNTEAGILEVARQLESAKSRYGRFRGRLWVALIDDAFRTHCPELMWGEEYRTAFGVARAAHATYMSPKSVGQTVEGLSAYVRGAVRVHLQKKFDAKNMPVARTPEEKKTDVINNIYKWVRRAQRRKLITKGRADQICLMFSTATPDNYGVAYIEPEGLAPKERMKKAPATKPVPAPRTSKGQKKAAASNTAPAAKTPPPPVTQRRQVPISTPPASKASGRSVADVLRTMRA